MQCIGKFASVKFVQHASDGCGQGFVSFAHYLLYLFFIFFISLIIFFCLLEIQCFRPRFVFSTACHEHIADSEQSFSLTRNKVLGGRRVVLHRLFLFTKIATSQSSGKGK